MKYFLLIAGNGYTPGARCQDWKKTFKTKEEAEAVVERLSEWSASCKYDGEYYDWYEIVDLREWIDGIRPNSEDLASMQLQKEMNVSVYGLENS